LKLVKNRRAQRVRRCSFEPINQRVYKKMVMVLARKKRFEPFCLAGFKPDDLLLYFGPLNPPRVLDFFELGKVD
jgi:hypothetical protein